MKDCWVSNADDRPSFPKLSRKFSKLLGARNHVSQPISIPYLTLPSKV